ncbi:MAG: hypothetical protein ACRDNG_02815, partial [Gaiellaceae bacterium]
SFTAWSLFDVGTSFLGNNLTDLIRRNDPATYDAVSLQEGPGANYVSFLYGTCVPVAEGGCPLPLEIQVSPACSRPTGPQLVNGVDVGLPPDETLVVRGVGATFYDEWTRLEISTGNAIVDIYGSSRTQLLQAANVLRGTNHIRSPQDPLPIPHACE